MRNGRLTKSLRIGLIVGDIVLITLGYFLAFWIRFAFQPPTVNLQPYIRLLPLIVFFALAFFNVYGLYQIERKNFVDIGSSLILSIFLLGIFIMASSFFFRAFSFPRSVILLGGIIQLILLLIWRRLVWIFSKALHGTKKILVVGKQDIAAQVIEKFSSYTKDWFKVVSVISGENKEILKQKLEEVDLVILCPDLSAEVKYHVTSLCVAENKSMLVIPELYDILLFKAKTFRVDDLPLFELEPIALSWDQQVTKRLLDISVASIALLFAIPLFIVVAILIIVTSPGPVFFIQERIGVNGDKFAVYKFRTMIDKAEKLTGPVLATENDPRITKIGKILRNTRMDELPQLINVLKGDMSIVGPRPERPVFVSEFTASDPTFGHRLKVKPGITGLAQVSGKYSTEPENKLRYDLLYIRNYSLGLDLKIILQTLKTVLTKEQANGVQILNQGNKYENPSRSSIRPAPQVSKSNNPTM